MTSGAPLALAVLSYVRQTGESVVVGDARTDERFASDPYIIATQPRSVLRAPIVHHGTLSGMLYLEHDLASDAFTPDRMTLMHILAAQAATSLENAKLYEAMKAEMVERRRAEEQLRHALAEMETLKNRLQVENVYLQEEIRQELRGDGWQ